MWLDTLLFPASILAIIGFGWLIHNGLGAQPETRVGFIAVFLVWSGFLYAAGQVRRESGFHIPREEKEEERFPWHLLPK